MDMFRRFLAAGESDPGQTNLEAYLEIWFQGMAWDKIKRGNMEELMAYGEGSWLCCTVHHGQQGHLAVAP